MTLKMKPKHILIITCILFLAALASAGAAAPHDDHPQAHPPKPADDVIAAHHPHGWTHGQIRETIDTVIKDKKLRPHEKLQAQTEALGMDARLQAWLEAPRDEETGEPIYSENIPIITPILSFFGLATQTPDEPYTQAEGQAAYEAYLDRYIAAYQSTGDFGGPIV